MSSASPTRPAGPAWMVRYQPMPPRKEQTIMATTTTTTFTGVLYRAERIGCTVNGNPRFRLIIATDGHGVDTYVTQSDAACSYDVENIARRLYSGAPDQSTRSSWHGVPVTFRLTRAGRVSHLAPVAMELRDYYTGDCLRTATRAEELESIAAASRDTGAGVIIADGRPCYVVYAVTA